MGDCSGHGTCEYIEDLATDAEVGGASDRHYIGSWDHFKSRGCKCDPHWEGNDCSSRKCPRGDDPLTSGVNEVQTLTLSSGNATGEFTLTYVDGFGMAWTTRPIDVTSSTIASDVEYALENLPNRVIRSVTVAASSAASIAVTFNAPSKPSALLVPNSASSRRPGCFPRSQGLRDSTFSTGQTYTVSEGGCSVSFTQDASTYSCSTCLAMSTPGRELANQGCCSLLVRQDSNSSAGNSSAFDFVFVSGASSHFPQSALSWSSIATDTTNIAVSGASCDMSTLSGGVVEVVVPATGPSYSISRTTTGTKEAAVCSNRGTCDGSTGLCTCFEGHTDEDCSIQTVLV